MHNAIDCARDALLPWFRARTKKGEKAGNYPEVFFTFRFFFFFFGDICSDSADTIEIWSSEVCIEKNETEVK